LKDGIPLLGRRPILRTERLCQTASVKTQDGRVTKMPRSTSSLRFDTERAGPLAEQAGPLGDNGEGRITVQGKGIELEPHNSQVSSFKRPGEGSALEEILRWVARSLAVMALLSSFALLCVGATPMLSSLPTYLANAVFRGWALIKKYAPVSVPALARGFFLSSVASHTAAAAVRVTEAVDARSSVSLVGSRPTHAHKQSYY
jgi:hypothetical protein